MQDLKIEIIDKIIQKGLKTQNLTKDKFHKLKNEIYKEYKLPKAISTVEIIERYNYLVKIGEVIENDSFKKVIRKRGVRSLSGVTVISLLTKQFYCPGKCVYCPTFEGLPKSYIPNEPAVQRAELNDFDPILQIHNRLRALEITGHKIEKNDVRIIGGTWSVYPKAYRDEFIKGIYDAFNTYDEMKDYIEETDLVSEKFASFKLKAGYGLKKSKTLEEAKKKNETSRCRVIGIAIETRPDWVNLEEIKSLREYGVTRVEIGYQTTIDEINILNKRGHGNAESIEATKMLKNAGFKVVAHMMPNLLGSTPELDRKALKEVFENPCFRPDELKIYPMVVTDKSDLTDIWKNGGFTPYDDETLINLTADLEEMIPEYVRLNRTYRDIPASEILAGSHVSNLRQIVEDKLNQKGVKLVDIRHREIKNKPNHPENAVLNIFEYEASEGKEYFLTFEDKEDRTIFSLLRLRLPNTSDIFLKNTSPLAPLLLGEGNNDGNNEERKNVLENYYESPDYIKNLLKDLRQNSTSFEEKLWQILRNRNFMGIKFRRQHPFGRYIADFYSNELKIVIELDGEIHKNQVEYDKIRDEIIEKYGVKVIRFNNEELNDLEKFLIKLQNLISPRLEGEGQGVRSEGGVSMVRSENELYSLLPELSGSAIIREIHTFGDQLSIGEAGSVFGQHLGFGKKLILKAEEIAILNGYKKMAVIAGVGVRGYYEKRGYHLEGEYMVKYL